MRRRVSARACAYQIGAQFSWSWSLGLRAQRWMPSAGIFNTSTNKQKSAIMGVRIMRADDTTEINVGLIACLLLRAAGGRWRSYIMWRRGIRWTIVDIADAELLRASPSSVSCSVRCQAQAQVKWKWKRKWKWQSESESGKVGKWKCKCERPSGWKCVQRVKCHCLASGQLPNECVMRVPVICYWFWFRYLQKWNLNI